ncbi:MAG: BatD family protein [Oligoflexales bacterium]
MKIFLIYVSLFVSLGSFAGVEVDIEPRKAKLGTTFSLSVQIEGSLDQEVELPDLEGIDVVGQQTQRGMTMGFGQGSGMTTTLIFHLRPQDVGVYKIPTFLIYADKKTYEIKDLFLEVLEQQPHRAGNDDPVFLERKLSQKKVFVGQPFLDTLLLHSIPGVLRRGHVVEYQLKGARAVQTEKKDAFQSEIQGTLYDVIPVHYVIIPGRSGQLDLPSHKAELSLKVQRHRNRRGWDPFDDFFQQGDLKEFWSPRGVVEVLPLPLPQPDSFSGLVGEFSGTSDLNKKSLKVGETATLTLRIEGDGELGPLGQYQLSQIDGLKFYEDQPEDKEVFHQFGMQSQRVLKFAVVPSHSGLFVIEPDSIYVFNPKKEIYEKLTFPSVKLRVEGEVSSAEIPLKEDYSENNNLAQSLTSKQPLKELARGHVYSSQGISSDEMILWMSLASAPWVLKFFFLLIRPIQKWRYQGRRKREAYQQLKKLKNKDVTGTEAMKSWICYVSAALDKDEQNLTLRDIEGVLSHDLYQKIKKIYETLESWSYGLQKLSSSQSKNLIQDVLKVAKEMEKSL